MLSRKGTNQIMPIPVRGCLQVSVQSSLFHIYHSTVSIHTVSRRLGHSSITTTSKIYVHAIQSADEIASDVIDGKLNPFHHDNDKEEAK